MWLDRHGTRLIGLVALSLVAILCFPIIVLIGVSLNAGPEQVFPPRGLSLRWYANIFNRDGFIEAAQLSVALALLSTLISVTISMVASVALVRHRFFGRDFLLTLCLSPLVVPNVVVGIAFLIMLSSLGVFRSLPALMLLHITITLPFAIRVIVASLTRYNIRIEEAAMSLGASPLQAFLRVTLPIVRPGMIAAGVFAFVTSFENFTASQFLVWDRTTLPVEIYTFVRTENDPTGAAISSLVVMSVIALVIVMTRVIGLNRLISR